LGALLFGGGKKYILSNNHVLGLLGHGQKGDPVSQPGLVDTQCSPRRVVAKLTFAAPITDNVDAAAAELIGDSMDPTGEIIGMGVPVGEGVRPTEEMPVKKSGRTTNITHGKIQSVANIKVSYKDGCRGVTQSVVPFTDQILIESQDGNPFADTGDSGSLVVTENGEPVGLLFAANATIAASNATLSGSSATLSAANPIKEVLAKLSTGLGSNLTFHPPVSNTTGANRASTFQAVELGTQLSGRFETSAQVFNEFMSEPNVVGVGIGGPSDQPELILYVQKALSVDVLEQKGFSVQGAQYEGMKVRIITTEPFRALNWNKSLSSAKTCRD
jgi:hypothetical protein